jgi:antitoxin component of MazEF toxin-antitoxin module
MYRKKLVRHGNSKALVLNADLLQMVDIDAAQDFVEIRVEGDSLVIRRAGGARRKPSSKRVAHHLLTKLDRLAAAGLTRELFKRISHDGKTLQEVSGNLMHGIVVDPITLARIEECFERHKNCRESWESTITAVLSRRARPTISEVHDEAP